MAFQGLILSQVAEYTGSLLTVDEKPGGVVFQYSAGMAARLKTSERS
jgi:hypothetical protein